MDLGSKIKNIRYNHNISQEELARILEINRNYLSRIETNKSLPTAEILTKLTFSFNISLIVCWELISIVMLWLKLGKKKLINIVHTYLILN